MFKEFVAANMPLARTMRRRGVCVYALNHGYGVLFIKIMEQPQSCIMCTFRCQGIFVREIFPKFIRMPQIYACNKFYKVFGGGGGGVKIN